MGIIVRDVLGYLLTISDMAAIRSVAGRGRRLDDEIDLRRLVLLGLADDRLGWSEFGTWTGGPRLTAEGRRVATEVLKMQVAS